jgi:hypothetical protein
VARVVALAVLVTFATAVIVIVRQARAATALAMASERLAAGDPAAAERLLRSRDDGRARAGRALVRALSGAGGEAEVCACAPEDLAYFRPGLLVEEAIRRGDQTGAVGLARLARETGGPGAGVPLAAALVEEFRRWGFDGGRDAGRILQVPQGELPLAKMAVGLDATDITPLHAARLAAVAAAGEMPEPALVAATDGALGLSPRTLPRARARTILDPPAAAVLRRAMEAVTQPGGTAEGVAPSDFRVAMKTGTASTPGQGYHVNYVGVGPLPHPTIAFCVRVTGQPTSAHVTRAAREVLSNLLQGLAGRSVPSPFAD